MNLQQTGSLGPEKLLFMIQDNPPRQAFDSLINFISHRNNAEFVAPHCSLFPCRSDVLCSACVTCFATMHVEGVHPLGPPPVLESLLQIGIILIRPPSIINLKRGRCSEEKKENKALSGQYRHGTTVIWFYPCTLVISHRNILFPKSI